MLGKRNILRRREDQLADRAQAQLHSPTLRQPGSNQMYFDFIPRKKRWEALFVLLHHLPTLLSLSLPFPAFSLSVRWPALACFSPDFDSYDQLQRASTQSNSIPFPNGRDNQCRCMPRAGVGRRRLLIGYFLDSDRNRFARLPEILLRTR